MDLSTQQQRKHAQSWWPVTGCQQQGGHSVASRQGQGKNKQITLHVLLTLDEQAHLRRSGGSCTDEAKQCARATLPQCICLFLGTSAKSHTGITESKNEERAAPLKVVVLGFVGGRGQLGQLCPPSHWPAANIAAIPCNNVISPETTIKMFNAFAQLLAKVQRGGLFLIDQPALVR